MDAAFPMSKPWNLLQSRNVQRTSRERVEELVVVIIVIGRDDISRATSILRNDINARARVRAGAGATPAAFIGVDFD